VAQLAAADDGRPPARDVAGGFPERGGVMSDTQEAAQGGRRDTRIVEEHHIVGPHGEDEIEAIDGGVRRWYHLRPRPRRRADLMGFSSTLWMALGWFLVILLVVFPFPWVW
jgi:hypothetical protein